MAKELVADQSGVVSLKSIQDYLASLCDEEKEQKIAWHKEAVSRGNSKNFIQLDVESGRIAKLKSKIDSILEEYNLDWNHPDIIEAKSLVDLIINNGVPLIVLIDYPKTVCKDEKRTCLYDLAFWYYSIIERAKEFGIELPE